jgi:hypothetical protein
MTAFFPLRHSLSRGREQREESFFLRLQQKIDVFPFGEAEQSIVSFLFRFYGLLFVFLRNRSRFLNFFPTFPAGQGNSVAAAQAGLGGEVLDSAVGAGKDFAHNLLLVTSCSLLGTG